MAAPEMAGECLLPEPYGFPGRWVGAVSMIVAPVLLLSGVLLRIRYHFFFPQQLAAFQDHPALISASYNLFLAGNIALWPAILTLVARIAARNPRLALWGGTFAIFGLFARTFHAGADYLAFQVARLHGLAIATSTVAGSYGPFHVVSILNGPILFGWLILSVGAYKSRTLGLVQAVALGLMSVLMIGILKGTSVTSVVAVGGLCVALVPLGIKILRMPPTPRLRTVLGWIAFVAVLSAALFFLGRQG